MRPPQIWNGPRRGISGNSTTGHKLEIGSRTSTRRPLIASHCFSLPLIAAHVHVEAAPCMRPPAIASAVAVTQTRTGNLRFQTITIHKQERD